MRERLLGREHPDTLTSVNNLGWLYLEQEHTAEAEPLLLGALEARERTLGKEHPDTLESVNNLGLLYKLQGKLEEAEPLILRALEARERTWARSIETHLRPSSLWGDFIRPRAVMARPSRI